MSDIKPQVYKDPRPAEHFQPIHDWIRANRPGWTYELVRLVMTPFLMFVYRGWALGAHNVPADGPFILAPNHFSNLDHFFTAVFIRRKVQFMAKSQLYRNPFMDYIYRVGGVFPIRRGYRDDEAFVTAYAILERGGCVGMYCEGGRSRSGRLGEPKAGVGRLALESGVPVVPVAIHGSASVRAWRRFRFPKVTVQFGEPVTFAPRSEPTHPEQLATSQEIFDRVKAMYVVLEAEGRKGANRRLRDEAGAPMPGPSARSAG